MSFVNREDEIGALDRWWAKRGAGLALVWGRRRVGKTALIQRFAEGKRAVFHTGAGRPATDELAMLSRVVAVDAPGKTRDLARRPFLDWEDAFDHLAEVAGAEPVLLVLDEFPALMETSPELPGVIRAFWDRARSRTKLRIVLSGSALRTMRSVQEQRAPLYGRLDLSLLLHPFRPHEAARMLGRLHPAERALVWGLVGGIPLYLEWWNQGASLRQNLERLICLPGGPLLTEGQLVLSTEAEMGDLGARVLYAVAAGRTKHNEIADAVGADPTRTLDRLVSLRLLERLVPVTEDPRRTRRRLYQISDNFLAFWLGVVDRHRAEIERGLGRSILPVLLKQLDDHIGPRWEDAFRAHLRRLGEAGDLGREVVAVGPFWSAAADPAEIDAVVLAGMQRTAVVVGEAKWTRRIDAGPVVRDLERKAAALPRRSETLRYAVAARDEVLGQRDVLRITAADIFS